MSLFYSFRTCQFLSTKVISSFLLLLVGAGCAKPNYANEGTNTGLATKPAGQRCTVEVSNGALCLKLTWEVFPTESQFGSFIFLISDLHNDQLVAASPSPLTVTLWMPSMGHGSSPVTVETIAPGIYRAKKVFFNMKGDWEIQFAIGQARAIHALDF